MEPQVNHDWQLGYELGISGKPFPPELIGNTAAESGYTAGEAVYIAQTEK